MLNQVPKFTTLIITWHKLTIMVHPLLGGTSMEMKVVEMCVMIIRLEATSAQTILKPTCSSASRAISKDNQPHDSFEYMGQ